VRDFNDERKNKKKFEKIRKTGREIG